MDAGVVSGSRCNINHQVVQRSPQEDVSRGVGGSVEGVVFVGSDVQALEVLESQFCIQVDFLEVFVVQTSFQSRFAFVAVCDVNLVKRNSIFSDAEIAIQPVRNPGVRRCETKTVEATVFSGKVKPVGATIELEVSAQTSTIRGHEIFDEGIQVG